MLSNKNDEAIFFDYIFEYPEKTKRFSVKLDKKTLDLMEPKASIFPDWALLANFSCPHCSLNRIKNKYCPVAVNLFEIIDFFKDSISYEEATVFIRSKERTYVKETKIQAGISSLIGIFMSSSGCPYLDELRPMVRFHLPFSSMEETIYKVVSMYLTSQYFKMRNNEEPDWELKNLVKIYKDIHIVNKNVSKNISMLSEKDANLNAIVILDTFANFTLFSIDSDELATMKEWFYPFSF